MTQFTCKGVKQINNRISFKHLYHSYLSAFFISTEFQMGNFQKYWSQNVGQDFIVLDFFVGGRSCGRKRCVREINVSHAGDPVHAGDKALTRETPAKRGRVNRYDYKQGYFSKYFVLNIETKIFYQYKKTNIVFFLFHIKSEFTNLVNDLDIHQLSQFEYIFL